MLMKRVLNKKGKVIIVKRINRKEHRHLSGKPFPNLFQRILNKLK